MAQRPKPEVREALLKAAAEAFAGGGFEGAALGEVVARAGTSIGNFYKYFTNKNELFASFIPRGFTTELASRLRAQVEALHLEPNAFALEETHPYRRASKELLAFSMAHRQQIVFLLLRAQGTQYECFAGELVRLLVELALEYAHTTYPGFAATPANKRALTRIYQAFVTTFGTILAEEQAEHAVRKAVALQVSYHLSGLKAFFLSNQPRGMPL